jgi:hypothetical protein
MTRPLESFLRDLASVRDTFLRVTGAWFDADVHGLPPLKMKQKSSGDVGKANPKTYLKVHPIAGRAFGERIDDDGQLVWENLAFKTAVQSARSAHLTDFDRDVLITDGLDELKAEALKPLWAAGMSSAQIVAAFNKDWPQYGFGLTTVKAYTSAFSSALSAELLAIEEVPGQIGSTMQ